MKMAVAFNFDEPKDFLRAYIAALPKAGWGEVQRWATYLSLQPSYISQVLAGKKQFTVDQALALSKYLGLTGIEQDYFMMMIEKDRAASFETKEYFEKKMKALKSSAKNVSKLVATDGQISEIEKSIFYSSWIYSAIRVYCSFEDERSLADICERFELSRDSALPILEFLVSSGLILEKNKKYSVGMKKTHLDSKSPYITRHRVNWHLKALENFENVSEEELVYSAPFSISPEDFQSLREELAQFIKRFVNKVNATDPSEMAVLNIDLLKLK